MPLSYDAPARLLTISTDNSTYQMKVDEYGYLLHLYYGARTEGDLSYLLTYCDRSGMCGCPHDVADRTYSLDVLPQEYPFQGSGDMRSPMLLVRDAEGTFGCDLRYKCHEIRPGKYDLPGLPAVYAGEKDDAETLSVTLADERLGLEVELLYGSSCSTASCPSSTSSPVPRSSATTGAPASPWRSSRAPASTS